MGCTISVRAELVTVYVDNHNVAGPWDGTPANPYRNITSGLEHAKDGNTIFVKAGTYREHVVVNESVSLIGEDRNSTIIDGNGNGTVISITANNVSIEGLTIEWSGQGPNDCGISIDHSTGNYISHNTITNDYEGIGLYSSSNNVVSGNNITDSYYGIGLYSSSNNVVSGNNITDNYYEGIGFYYSGNNVVSGNTITDNYYGIGFYYSGNNVVSGNTITDNYYGIAFYYSGNNVVSGNTITDNYYGIAFSSSSNNNICRNNFINNTNQVCSDSTNVWDDGIEGNYWSDYTGHDRGDGIGDTPYVIPGVTDNRPLMGMFSDFSVIYQEETHHVTVISNSTVSEFEFEIGPETGNKIIRFNVTGKDGTVGFCRVRIPTELMNYSYIVLVDSEEIVPTLLDVSNATYVYLYFTYLQSSHAITIISSETLYLYNELLDKNIGLQINLYNLNATYQDLLSNYGVFLGNYCQLQEGYRELNDSYQDLLSNYGVFLGNYCQLQEGYRELNDSYQDLLSNYGVFLGNYCQLQEGYRELNDSYHEHLLDYSKNVQNIRNLMYIFAAITAIFIVTTIYLSKHAHTDKTKVFKDKNGANGQKSGKLSWSSNDGDGADSEGASQVMGKSYLCIFYL
jgi:nitrous oxidase accessory protein